MEWQIRVLIARHMHNNWHTTALIGCVDLVQKMGNGMQQFQVTL
jgi:hypothetical protein